MATIVTWPGEVKSPVVVDTDVISMLFKRDPRSAPYVELLRGLPLVASFMTYAELYQWTRLHNWGDARIEELEGFLADYSLMMSTKELCHRWADVRAEARAAGRPISAQDAWHAALALHFGVPLVTNNARDFTMLEHLRIMTAASVG